MRKLTTILASAALVANVATGSIGAPDGLRIPSTSITNVVGQNNKMVAPVYNARKYSCVAGYQHARKASGNRALKAAPIDVVKTQPEGTLYLNEVAKYDGVSYNWLYGFYNTSTDNGVVSIVQTNDGALYINGLFGSIGTSEEYWVRAEKEIGDTYVIAKQIIGYDSNYDETIYITRLAFNEDKGMYEEDASNTSISFTWKDGELKSAETYEGSSVPNYAFGLVVESVDEDTNESVYNWNGTASWNYSSTKQTDTYVTPPSSAEIVEVIMKYNEGNESYATKVSAAKVGSDVYLKIDNALQGWIKGTIEGGVLTVSGNQYLGTGYGYHIYLHITDAEYDEEEELYDFTTIKDKGTLSYTESPLRIVSTDTYTIDAAKNKIYYVSLFDNPEFYIYTEKAATPAAPSIDNFFNYDTDYEFGYVDFSVPNLDENGDYIDPEKLAYRVYIDDNIFEFDPDEYPSLTQLLTEIPANFADDNAIYTYGEYSKEILFYFEIAKNIGIQSVYYGGGEVHESEIVWYEVKKQTETFVGEVETNAEVISTTYHDLTGKEVDLSVKGILLKTEILSDGTTRSTKILNR